MTDVTTAIPRAVTTPASTAGTVERTSSAARRD